MGKLIKCFVTSKKFPKKYCILIIITIKTRSFKKTFYLADGDVVTIFFMFSIWFD